MVADPVSGLVAAGDAVGRLITLQLVDWVKNDNPQRMATAADDSTPQVLPTSQVPFIFRFLLVSKCALHAVQWSSTMAVRRWRGGKPTKQEWPQWHCSPVGQSIKCWFRAVWTA